MKRFARVAAEMSIGLAAVSLNVSCQPGGRPRQLSAAMPDETLLATPAKVPPIYPQPITPTPAAPQNPTRMSRVADGYELINDSLRVVISDISGDVVFLGTPAGRNLLLKPGITARLSGLPHSVPAGYVEPRDTQTWQYYGTDANQITWRKIYCLDGPRLLASFIYQNGRRDPFTSVVQLSGNLIGVRIERHQPDVFVGASAFGRLSLLAYNENHAPAPAPALPILLQSDTRSCPPGERQSLTSQWTLDDAATR